MAVKYNIINKAGSWYSYGEEKIGQGKENVMTYLESNPDIMTEIRELVLEYAFPKVEVEEEPKIAPRKKKATEEEATLEIPTE